MEQLATRECEKGRGIMAEYLVNVDFGVSGECDHRYVIADRPYEAKVKYEEENPGATVTLVALVVWEGK